MTPKQFFEAAEKVVRDFPDSVIIRDRGGLSIIIDSRQAGYVDLNTGEVHRISYRDVDLRGFHEAV